MTMSAKSARSTLLYQTLAPALSVTRPMIRAFGDEGIGMDRRTAVAEVVHGRLLSPIIGIWIKPCNRIPAGREAMEKPARGIEPPTC